jgi:tRNA (guanine-N7-)-methyltransferase
MHDNPPSPHPRRKLYGRRRGPRLSAHQDDLLETLLPTLSLAPVAGRDPRSYFPSPAEGEAVSDVWLEVGFGAGEHLLWQAAQHPRIGLIGAEPYLSGVAKLLSKLAASPDREPRSAGGRNLRLYTDDARNILDALPDASLGRVFLLFPDPWPKTRHHKRRFVQMELLDVLARVMRPGTEFRFASDDADYANWTLERFLAHPDFRWTAACAADWRSRSPDWPKTRYEAKALHGVPVFLRFRRL